MNDPHGRVSTRTVDPTGRAVAADHVAPKPGVAAIAQRALHLEEEIGGDATPAVLLEQEEIGPVDVALAQLDPQPELAQVRIQRGRVAVDPPVVADQLLAVVGDETVKALLDVMGEAPVHLRSAALAVQLRELGQMLGSEILEAQVAVAPGLDDRVE